MRVVLAIFRCKPGPGVCRTASQATNSTTAVTTLIAIYAIQPVVLSMRGALRYLPAAGWYVLNS